jgi:hypothetical protein
MNQPSSCDKFPTKKLYKAEPEHRPEGEEDPGTRARCCQAALPKPGRRQDDPEQDRRATRGLHPTERFVEHHERERHRHHRPARHHGADDRERPQLEPAEEAHVGRDGQQPEREARDPLPSAEVRSVDQRHQHDRHEHHRRAVRGQ